MSEFDTTPYHRLPQLSTGKTIALATKILARSPGDLTADTRGAAKRIRTDLGALKVAYAAKSAQLPPKTPDRKGADLAVDTAWAALQGRLLACSYLPVDLYPESARAREAMARIFPGGLAFLTYEYEAEWAESESKLQGIDAGGLAPLLDQIAGPAYLAEVRRTHALYGEALGMKPGVVAPTPDAVSIAPLRDALRKSIATYVRKLLAQVDEEDAASVARVTEALSPIVEARSRAADRRDDGEDDEDPTDGSQGETKPTDAGGQP